MRYTITSDTVGLAIGPVSETANSVREALGKARQLCETAGSYRRRSIPNPTRNRKQDLPGLAWLQPPMT